MAGFESIGRILLLVGVFLTLSGVLFIFWHKIPFIGKLPGDIFLQRGDIQFFFPLVTCLVLSAILTIIVNLIIGLFGR